MINSLQWGSGINLNKISSITRIIAKKDASKHNSPHENQMMSYKAIEIQIMAMAEADKSNPLGNKLNTFA